MDLKDLKAKRDEVIDKMTEMNELAVNETRNFNDDEEVLYRNLESELENLKSEIEKAKEEIRSNSTEINDMEVKEMNKDLTVEERAIEQLVRGEVGEELRAVTTTANATDAIAEYVQNEVIARLEEVAPLFAQAQRYVVADGTLSIPKEDANNLFDFGFVGEEEELAEKQINIETVVLDGHRCGAFITVTKEMIKRESIDIVGYVMNLLVRRFGASLDKAMILGKVASKSFEGLESLTVSTHKITEQAETAVTADMFVRAINTLHPSLIEGAVFVMGKEMYIKVAQLTDASGQYVLSNVRGIADQAPKRMIMGVPVLVSDAMDLDGTAKNNIYLVNVREAYGSLVRQDAKLSRVDADSVNLRKGTVQFFLDADADCKLKNGQAVLRIKVTDEE